MHEVRCFGTTGCTTATPGVDEEHSRGQETTGSSQDFEDPTSLLHLGLAACPALLEVFGGGTDCCLILDEVLDGTLEVLEVSRGNGVFCILISHGVFLPSEVVKEPKVHLP